MKKVVIVLFAAFSLVSCISSSEDEKIIFDRDIKTIEKYVAENPITTVKEFNDPAIGILLQWRELSNSGISVLVGDSVSVNYTGRLVNNTVFDTSIESVAKENNIFNSQRTYAPFTFIHGANRVIVGFDYAISRMQKGDKLRVLIPSYFGYGRNPTGAIPGNSVLAFDLELVDVKPKTNSQ
jgi:FKBP-type peptidyl-prolyl cis-trans isomerase FklB